MLNCLEHCVISYKVCEYSQRTIGTMGVFLNKEVNMRQDNI